MRLNWLFNSSQREIWIGKAGKSEKYSKEYTIPYNKILILNGVWFPFFSFFFLFSLHNVLSDIHRTYTPALTQLRMWTHKEAHKIYNDKTEPELINYIRLVSNIWLCQFNSDYGLV